MALIISGQWPVPMAARKVVSANPLADPPERHRAGKSTLVDFRRGDLRDAKGGRDMFGFPILDEPDRRKTRPGENPAKQAAAFQLCGMSDDVHLSGEATRRRGDRMIG